MKARQISEEIFEQLMQGNKPVLVDFWAPWCPYCVKITEAYDAIAEQYGDDIEVVKVNIDDYEPLSDREGIEVIPTLVLYQNGKKVDSVVAPESKAAIEQFIGQKLEIKKNAADAHVYDMVIVGGGPAGYTAALYAVRAGLDTLVLEKLAAGGQMTLTTQIDNYPGFAQGVDGTALAADMKAQAHRFGARTISADVLQTDLTARPKVLTTSEGVFYARTVVIATGANPKALGLPEEKELVGRGVAYCAACDGMFYKDKTVAVIGGGNSAAADALLLSRIARKVIVVHRRDTLRATKVYHEPLMQAENVTFKWNSVATEIVHDARVTGLKIKNVHTDEEEILDVDGVFISVGRAPASHLAQGQLDVDAGGYIVAGEDTRTNIPGVYAAGDVRTKVLRQIVTAVADGAVAVHMAQEYLMDNP